MALDPQRFPDCGGTYALFLELAEPARLEIGRLGTVGFSGPCHLYVGSAFGPGGLRARLLHHLHPARRPHWHVDHLRRVASLAGLWLTTDPRRLECAWAAAARSLRGSRPVSGFGASDCRCGSHLFALPRAPRRATFRRHLGFLAPPCGPIHVWPLRP